MFVAERFIIASLINKFGKCPVSTDGGGTWYPQTCQSVSGRRRSSSYPFLIWEKYHYYWKNNPIYQR